MSRLLLMDSVYMGKDGPGRPVPDSPGSGFIRVWLDGVGETGTDPDGVPLYGPLAPQSGPQGPEKHLTADTCAGELPHWEQLLANLQEMTSHSSLYALHNL